MGQITVTKEVVEGLTTRPLLSYRTVLEVPSCLHIAPGNTFVSTVYTSSDGTQEAPADTRSPGQEQCKRCESVDDLLTIGIGFECRFYGSYSPFNRISF